MHIDLLSNIGRSSNWSGNWNRGRSLDRRSLGKVQSRVAEGQREVTVVQVRTSLEFSNGDPHTFGGNAFVSIGFPVFSTDELIRGVSTQVVTVVGTDDTTTTVIKDSDVLASSFAGVGVGSSVSSANRVSTSLTSTLIDFVLGQTVTLVGNGDSFASGLTCVRVGTSVGSTDREVDILTTGTRGQRTGLSFVRTISRTHSVRVLLTSRTVQVALVVVCDSVAAADRRVESFAMRTMGGFSVRTLAGFPEFLVLTLHHTSVLVSLHSFGTDRFVDIGTVARVETSTFVFDHLMSTLDCTHIFVSGTILTTDWGELIIARTVEVGGFGPIEVVARTIM